MIFVYHNALEKNLFIDGMIGKSTDHSTYKLKKEKKLFLSISRKSLGNLINFPSQSSLRILHEKAVELEASQINFSHLIGFLSSSTAKNWCLISREHWYDL